MTTKEKRENLKTYCTGRICSDCPLYAIDHCDNFTFDKMNDEQIEKCYNIAFNPQTHSDSKMREKLKVYCEAKEKHDNAEHFLHCETGKKASDSMKFNIEIECTDNSKVTEEKLYGYVLRAIASVAANNYGIITNMSCTLKEDKTDRK